MDKWSISGQCKTFRVNLSVKKAVCQCFTSTGIDDSMQTDNDL